ncbi:hypothetical protein [Segetibacter koreensis]|uniref:hypothetical protein n=1 Tax=Segetibacter koreensis TaxID=398037 RepID=UPI000365E104|nr:hypothetical protein [Segetibacter koreensis]
MVYDFLVTLKKPDYKVVDQVSQLMYIFALLVFGFYYYHYPKSGAGYLYFGVGILLAWIYTIIKKRKNGQAYFRLGLLIAAVGWFVGPQRNIWMAILYAVAALLEKQVKFPQEIGFSENEISFNSFPRKVLKWGEINNTLIKDGLLTIDFKNNMLFQKEIEGYVTTDIEKEFNDFCLRCINSVAKKNDADRSAL